MFINIDGEKKCAVRFNEVNGDFRVFWSSFYWKFQFNVEIWMKNLGFFILDSSSYKFKAF